MELLKKKDKTKKFFEHTGKYCEITSVVEFRGRVTSIYTHFENENEFSLTIFMSFQKLILSINNYILI